VLRNHQLRRVHPAPRMSSSTSTAVPEQLLHLSSAALVTGGEIAVTRRHRLVAQMNLDGSDGE
jgi:hypothetical protein